MNTEELLSKARKLRERGAQSEFSEDEALHLAQSVLDLMVEVLQHLDGIERRHPE